MATLRAGPQLPRLCDLLIRRGTVVDGTGAPSFVGDVAVDGAHIVAIGPTLDLRGRREYDARGLVVAPGWVDCHTHFDAQATWDPYLAPSSTNGVTTCIFGNCGIGFAPCQKDRREFLSHLVESVEDIPFRIIAEGMQWDWETFEEYMDSLERREYACDVAVMVGHLAVRTWVMGRRANNSDAQGGRVKAPVTEGDIAAMASVVRDAVAVGALGFSTSRLLQHRDPNGRLIPGTLAGRAELLAMARAVVEAGGGIFQMTTDFASYDDIAYTQVDPARQAEYIEAEREWLESIAREHGNKVRLSWNTVYSNVAEWRDAVHLGLSMLEGVVNAGGSAMGQTFTRPQGFLMAFGARLHPFVSSPSFQHLQRRTTTPASLCDSLRQPEHRRRVLHEVRQHFSPETLAKSLELCELFGALTPWSLLFPWSPGYEPRREDSILATAEREGRTPLEVAFDLLAAGAVLWKPKDSFPPTLHDHTGLYELLNHPLIHPGGADAGAHHGIFQDGTSPTHLLTHWVRDRANGPRLTLERAVQLQTHEVAQHFGLRDRGVLAVGMKADINIIDLQRLRLKVPRFAQDLPMGAGRWLQDVEGYMLTLVSGCETHRAGQATGALPGRLVRNPQRIAVAWTGAAAQAAGPFDVAEIGKDDDEVGTSRRRALEGAGSAGGSAVARVLRETVEAPQSKL